MSAYRRLAAAGVLILLSACSDPVSVDPHELTGSWLVSESLQPRGSMNRILRFWADGRFVSRVETYGVYAASEGLSSYSETRGRFEATGNRLELAPRSIVTWDSFYGDPFPRISEFQGTLLDDCTFQIEGDELTLNYLSYPADAPVETTMRLHRIR